MKQSGKTRTCPECGRTLNTTVNRFGVEMWPQHMHATYGDKTMSYWDNVDREDFRKDNKVPCPNSAQPV